MELCSNGIITRLILGSFYWLYNTRAYRSACTYFRGVVQVSVQGALARTAKASNATTSESQDAQEEQINLLDDLALQTRDEERLTSMASDMLVAGRDTTAALLSGLILHLARDPAAYAKLRIAVLNDFGPRTGDEYMTFEQLKQCQYLQFCMKETLRLSPSVAYGFMTASVDTTLPAGGGPRGDRPIFVVKVCVSDEIEGIRLTTTNRARISSGVSPYSIAIPTSGAKTQRSGDRNASMDGQTRGDISPSMLDQ